MSAATSLMAKGSCGVKEVQLCIPSLSAHVQEGYSNYQVLTPLTYHNPRLPKPSHFTFILLSSTACCSLVLNTPSVCLSRSDFGDC